MKLPLVPLSILGAAALVLTGCASTPAADDDRIQVVASTSVYGDLAATIGGQHVVVTSIISNPAQDPHSYEATARDQLAISRADLVIHNGGGYDSFVEVLLEASGSDAVVIEAVAASGLLGDDHDHGVDNHDDHGHEDDDHEGHDHGDEDHGHEGHDHIAGFNEHVWYDLHAAEAIVEEIVHELGHLAPELSAEFETNAGPLLAGIAEVHDRSHELQHDFSGLSFAVSEPVPVYLLQGAGLSDVTPPDFAEAIEEGADVPPAALLQMLQLIEHGEIALLGYNEQTSSPETERVLAVAREAGIPVVSFTELLPEGADYVSWMRANLQAIEDALAP